jgi:NAD(P)-dependent dehydrogenase (short-subunit alcohol dehydrogenase family)
VFGDLNEALGGNLAQETGATFVKTDVSVYDDQVRLFDAAYTKHGAVDHAIANAGIYEPPGLFDPSADVPSLARVRSSEPKLQLLLPVATANGQERNPPPRSST